MATKAGVELEKSTVALIKNWCRNREKCRCSQKLVSNFLLFLKNVARPFSRSTPRFVAKLRKQNPKRAYAWEPSGKLGFNWPPCEPEPAFRSPNELKIPNTNSTASLSARHFGEGCGLAYSQAQADIPKVTLSALVDRPRIPHVCLFQE